MSSSREKKFAKPALFEYARLQPDPESYLSGQFYKYTPSARLHFLVPVIYPNAVTRHTNRLKMIGELYEYTKTRSAESSYALALARYYVYCSGAVLPECVWDDTLKESVARICREEITSKCKDWNQEQVLSGPAHEWLDPIQDIDMDRACLRYLKNVTEPIQRALPSIAVVKQRCSSEKAELYRSLIEHFESSGTLDLHDSLERGRTRSWNTVSCESKLRLLQLVHDAELTSIETGVPIALAAQR